MNATHTAWPTAAECYRSFVESFRDAARLRGIDVIEGRQVCSLRKALDGNLKLHISARPRAWWGTAENVLRRLRDEGRPWAIVLSHMDADGLRVGYFIESEVADDMIRSGRWPPQEKDGVHWKINPPHGLAGAFRFSSIDELIGIIRVTFNACEKGTH